MLTTLRRFYQFLEREELLTGKNPTAHLLLPKIGRRLPQVPSQQQVKAVLELPAHDSDLGIAMGEAPAPAPLAALLARLGASPTYVLPELRW